MEDHIQQVGRLAAGPGLVAHELGRAEDHRQQVVEVVGDAAGELPDRLHLLRLAQLAFALAVGGDVDAGGDETGLAIDLHHLGRGEQDQLAAVGSGEMELETAHGALLRQRLAEAVDVVAAETDADFLGRAADDAVALKTSGRQVAAIHLTKPAVVEIGDRDQRRAGFEHRGEAALGLRALNFRQLAPCDVAHGGNEQQAAVHHRVADDHLDGKGAAVTAAPDRLVRTLLARPGTGAQCVRGDQIARLAALGLSRQRIEVQSDELALAVAEDVRRGGIGGLDLRAIVDGHDAVADVLGDGTEQPLLVEEALEGAGQHADFTGALDRQA